MRTRGLIAAVICLILGMGSTAARAQREAALTSRASGTFDVKLSPQATDEREGTTFGRMSIDKQFHGTLEGTGEGEMLSAGTSVKGSAGTSPSSA